MKVMGSHGRLEWSTWDNLAGTESGEIDFQFAVPSQQLEKGFTSLSLCALVVCPTGPLGGCGICAADAA